MISISKLLDAIGKPRLLSSLDLSEEALFFGVATALLVELLVYFHERQRLEEENERSGARPAQRRGD